jgi:hypothetical protein
MIEVPECIIEHRHWSFGKSAIDPVYQNVIDQQNCPANMAAVQEWRAEKPAIIERLLNGRKA